MIIGPLAAALLQLGVSRQREYLADATAARMPREGGLWPTRSRTSRRAPRRADGGEPRRGDALHRQPFSGAGVTKLLSTHPPIADRVRRLREHDRAAGIHYLVPRKTDALTRPLLPKYVNAER